MQKIAIRPLVLIIILLAISSGLGFFLGTRYPKVVTVTGVDNIQNDAITNADFGIFWETWQVVKENYLRSSDVKDKDLVYGATTGLINALKDPHSVFLPPRDSQKFNED